MAFDANVCPYCGHDYRVAAAPPAKKHTVMPLIGGIMIIIGALIELAAGAWMVIGGASVSFVPLVGDMASGILVACGAIMAIVGLVALLGGIFAIQRKHFGIAVVGGIFALPGWFIPALIGLILVAVSKDEFD